jgi:hypothetical protein
LTNEEVSALWWRWKKSALKRRKFCTKNRRLRRPAVSRNSALGRWFRWKKSPAQEVGWLGAGSSAPEEKVLQIEPKTF